MRYLCTIYTHDCSFAGRKGFAATEPAFDAPVASVIVDGPTLRDAAARAYVRVVGRQRAQGLRRKPAIPNEVIAQETSPRAIAASLRKVARRVGECYEMDNLVDAWSIQVQPVSVTTRLPRNLRLSSKLIYHSSRFPSPN
jgi:hypothetical protein